MNAPCTYFFSPACLTAASSRRTRHGSGGDQARISRTTSAVRDDAFARQEWTNPSDTAAPVTSAISCCTLHRDMLEDDQVNRQARSRGPIDRRNPDTRRRPAACTRPQAHLDSCRSCCTRSAAAAASPPADTTGLPPVSASALHAEGNPLQEPISELINRGSDALVAYLRSLEDAIPQYEAKVLLVGEGNVGKTSLLAALLNEPFIEKRETTHGIEIRPLIMRHPDIDVDMTIRAWDFGGQELYRITHQFFYSRRAVYLVVWNAREGQESNEVDGWLRRIRLRVSRDARALIVATHTDERRPELDYPFLEQNFPILLAGRYEIDNRSGHGIDSLREGIAAEVANLPQMGQLISPRWIAVRDEVITRARTEPQITYEQFAQICSRHGVVGDEINTLAELLHDLGQIIYYGEDEGLKEGYSGRPVEVQADDC